MARALCLDTRTLIGMLDNLYDKKERFDVLKSDFDQDLLLDVLDDNEEVITNHPTLRESYADECLLVLNYECINSQFGL